LIYTTCKDCVAKPFCSKYKKEIPVIGSLEWCAEYGRLYKALELSGMPKEYTEANLYGNYDIDSVNEPTYNKLVSIIKRMPGVVDDYMNILITGAGCGVGKTYSGAVILNHYIYKTCLTGAFDYESPLALYVDYTQFINDLRDFDNNSGVKALFRQMKKVPLLMIDDIGSGIMSRFTREQTFIILNARYNNGLSTIITSNISPSSLASDDFLGPRNVSRLTRQSLWLEMKGSDRRKSKLGGI